MSNETEVLPITIWDFLAPPVHAAAGIFKALSQAASVLATNMYAHSRYKAIAKAEDEEFRRYAGEIIETIAETK